MPKLEADLYPSGLWQTPQMSNYTEIYVITLVDIASRLLEFLTLEYRHVVKAHVRKIICHLFRKIFKLCFAKYLKNFFRKIFKKFFRKIFKICFAKYLKFVSQNI